MRNNEIQREDLNNYKFVMRKIMKKINIKKNETFLIKMGLLISSLICYE